MKYRDVSSALFLLIVISASAALAASADEQPPPTKPSSRQIAAGFIARLQSHDETQIAAAVEGLRATLKKTGKFGRPADVVGLSLDALLDAGQFEAADEFAAAMLNNTPFSIDRVEAFLTVRIRAKVALHQPGSALVLAKSFYNVCRMKNTNQAITLVCDCLYELNGRTDAGIDAGRNFKMEQIRGATASSADISTTRPSGNTPLLQSIHVESIEYADAIAFARRHAGFPWLTGLGNLLLMSDQPAEAEQVFRKACIAAGNKEELATATEGVARAMRACDGTVGRANAWVVSFMQRPDPNSPVEP